MESYHRYHKFNGVVLVANKGRVLFEKGFGPAVVEFGVMNTPRTRFRIASITKVFTTTLILQLIDEKLVELDKPIGKYLDGVRPEIAGRVTVRHLLEHTSGLAREYFPRSQNLNRNYSMTELLDAVNKNTKLINEPGSAVSYSNAGFVLLAAMIENVTGSKYREALQERIFTPLEMNDTGVEQSITTLVPRLASGYRLRLGTYIPAARISMSWTRGNGGIFSTASDVLRFDQALRGPTLLSEKAKSLFFRKGIGSFALTWQVGNNPTGYPTNIGRIAWARGANQGGFRVQWTRQLDDDRTVILLSNLDYSPRNEITKKIFSLLLGESITLPERPLSDIAVEAYDRKGTTAAEVILTRARKKDENRTGQAINEILELGHHLIRTGKPKKSIGLFKMCDKLYPNTAGIIVSTAFAYLESGNLDEAKKLAQRVLTIDSENKDARLILKQVQNRH
jgi:CubicO group peptidase (beta-lactamase class C family)